MGVAEPEEGHEEMEPQPSYSPPSPEKLVKQEELPIKQQPEEETPEKEAESAQQAAFHAETDSSDEKAGEEEGGFLELNIAS
mmetsp:Transcript_12471/g.19495  ORF Transcript_12471/g.19495 Transcript_12471/m.19495 type:complete len:82 (+) Transcript_12471:342-587(+)